MVTKKLTPEEKEKRKADRIANREASEKLAESEGKEPVTSSEAAKEAIKTGEEIIKACEKEIRKKAKKLPTIVNTKRYSAREVKVDLSDKEINEAAIELAHKQKQYAEIEEEMKGHASNYKDRLKEITVQMKSLGNKVTLKYEYRKFSCEVWLNFKTKERVYKDRENHKVIDTAGLEADDYQLRLAV